MKMKIMIKKYLCNKMKNKNSWKYIINKCKSILSAEEITYSQNCEDIILDVLSNKNKGVYVDIGAHHPIRFSNTFRLYLKGWNGINIDPLPNVMNVFNEYRPDDINLNIGVSNKCGTLTYYNFKEPAFNTLNAERAKNVLDNQCTELIEKVDVPVDTLSNILNKFLNGRTIDVLTLDVENYELPVLQSNNWDIYRPRIIVMESLISKDENIENLFRDPAVNYLTERGYFIVSKFANAVFLKDGYNM